MISEVRRPTLNLTLTARLLWAVVAAIVVVCVVLISIGAATT
jgi:hypothetical protein